MADSVAWKDWYIGEWGIPAGNVLGLDVSGDEKVTIAHFQSRIFDAVVGHLDQHPELDARIMGILVGYRVPGNFFEDAQRPNLQGGGGWSVAGNLQDLTSSTWYRRANQHYFAVVAMPPGARLTKSSLSPRFYLTARIDAPTLEQAKDLTRRARAISTHAAPLPDGDYIYHDYLDPGAPAGDVWYWLQQAVQCGVLNTPPGRFPWLAWESEYDPSPHCALHFSYYRLTGWQDVNWGGTPPGPRILAYALNSWGATTVRSTTGHGGRFVPNALFNGGFAAAIGATAEPYLTSQVDVSSLVWCLAEGWTLGEAMFRATPYHNWMWELNGDPLLRVPAWFGEPQNQPPARPSDLGPDEVVSGGCFELAIPRLTFVQSDPDSGDLLSFRLQIDDDPDFASPVVDYVSPPQPQGGASYTVGQPAGGGLYLAGEADVPLDPGAYYWRVRSSDGRESSEWAVARDGEPAFVVIPPAGLVVGVSDGGTVVSEDGRVGFYSVVLQSPPLEGAQVAVLSTPSPQLDLGSGGGVGVVLVFDRENWDRPQSVGVRAVDDDDCENEQVEALAFAVISGDPRYDGLPVPSLLVRVLDDQDCDHGEEDSSGIGLPPEPPPDQGGGVNPDPTPSGGVGEDSLSNGLPPLGGLSGGCGLGSLSAVVSAVAVGSSASRRAGRRGRRRGGGQSSEQTLEDDCMEGVQAVPIDQPAQSAGVEDRGLPDDAMGAVGVDFEL